MVPDNLDKKLIAKGSALSVVAFFALSELRDIRRDVAKIKIKIEVIMQKLRVSEFGAYDLIENLSKKGDGNG